jgi:hypothetical protein
VISGHRRAHAPGSTLLEPDIDIIIGWKTVIVDIDAQGGRPSRATLTH